MSDILTIEGLCKTFRRKSDTVAALDHVSVAFPRESICGLLGNNGAGKTTLIKCVCGLLLAEEGRVMLDGEDILLNAAVRKKKISVVLDGGRNLFWYMTLRENLRYFLMLKNQPYRSNAIDRILQQLGLSDLKDKQLQRLSFGMRQRASIAVALASCADIIFMDEPTNGLDVRFQEELVQLIRNMREEYHCTFVISSHDMSFVEALCEHCILINQGKIIHTGSLDSFQNAFGSSEYQIRYSPTDTVVDFSAVPLHISSRNEQERRFQVIWPREQPLNELFHVLDQYGLRIEEIDRSDGLAAAITVMTGQR